MFIDNPQFLQITPTITSNLSRMGLTVADWLTWWRYMAVDSTVESLALTWTLMLLAFLLLPLATVTSLPSDRKDDAGELLRATPLTGLGYLAGRILGMLVVVLPLAALTLGLFLIALDAAFIHFFDEGIPGDLVLFYLQLTILDGLPILIWGSTIGILAGIPFKRRRTAILPCFVSGLFSIFFWGFAFSPLKSFSLLDFAGSYLVQHYPSAAQAFEVKHFGEAAPLMPSPIPPVSPWQVLGMITTVLAGLLILVSLARQWLKWKEHF
jgi:hypothetical protein